MSRIRLYYQMATEVVESDSHDGLLILTDAFQERQMAIPCDGAALDEFQKRSERKRQLNGLVDVLFKVIRWQTDLDLEIVITGLTEGKYTAILNNVDTLDQIAIDVPDAVLLSYVSKEKIPIFIDEKLFLKQSSTYDVRAKGVSLPVNTLPLGMLRKALDKAIKNENYELAGLLRDEIKKRQK